jgi:phage gp46-like protein
MSSSLRYFKQPETLRYDPAIRDYVLLSNGSTDTMHYVDQRVALSLSIISGTLSGDSTLGTELNKIKRFNTIDAIADAKRAVSVALQDIINDGEITLKDIIVKFPVRGRMTVEIKYVNEILSRSLQPKIESVTIGGSLRWQN